MESKVLKLLDKLKGGYTIIGGLNNYGILINNILDYYGLSEEDRIANGYSLDRVPTEDEIESLRIKLLSYNEYDRMVKSTGIDLDHIHKKTGAFVRNTGYLEERHMEAVTYRKLIDDANIVKSYELYVCERDGLDTSDDYEIVAGAIKDLLRKRVRWSEEYMDAIYSVHEYRETDWNT